MYVKLPILALKLQNYAEKWYIIFYFEKVIFVTEFVILCKNLSFNEVRKNDFPLRNLKIKIHRPKKAKNDKANLLQVFT